MRRRLPLLVLPIVLATGACTLPGGGGPQPASLTASPGLLQLQTTSGGADDTGTVTITNPGAFATQGALQVTPFGSFVPTTDGCTGVVLGPGDDCELGFTYPAAAGLEARESSVFVSAPGGLLTQVRVSGRTVAP